MEFPKTDQSSINILIVGDLVGTPGLKAVENHLPRLKAELNVGCAIVNAENVYDGKGIRPSDAEAIFASGADVITSGNHVWEKWQSKKVLGERPDVLRPLNYPPGNVGNGYYVKRFDSGVQIAVLNLQGRTFMQDIDCPFRTADWALGKIDKNIPIIVDFHAEATAEKIAMGWYLDGRVSAVVGTHTHVPTADGQILPQGTAYLTDLGMTGPYDSVIGMVREEAIKRFLYKTPFKYETATDDVRLCGLLVQVDLQSCRATAIQQIISPSFRDNSRGEVS
ncbi:MAG: TIGR00282 family metallophosphoesterase [Ignavibacteriae bacterium]|nr:TIGR00282 family metallophosphoesterase [Ignavibacteriota bacterium]MCB9217788.1 TIGR00282 family metallophosphoesterase [Ignavibacteria bacterium]